MLAVKISKLTTGTMDKPERGLPMVYQEATKLGKSVEFQGDGEEFRVILER